MDIARLKEIVAMMTANDLSEVEIKGDKESITIKRGGVVTVQTVAAPAPVQAHAAPAAPAPAPAPAAPGTFIESPMVGTFYLTPNPDAAPFVKVGQTVSADTVVCIIEAMKVFNEIKAEKAGVVESVLAKSGQAVEFGQKLFAIKPL
ncbi:MAG: acetyl-CoA carboxylase biotin carboxyl carrier protein [Phycisphaeraceae bacterium]|nr:acetyl-CoA carboxylase biotin carboxyl carrier protein [Phycisphaeraceae bacterium]